MLSFALLFVARMIHHCHNASNFSVLGYFQREHLQDFASIP